MCIENAYFLTQFRQYYHFFFLNMVTSLALILGRMVYHCIFEMFFFNVNMIYSYVYICVLICMKCTEQYFNINCLFSNEVGCTRITFIL